MPVLGPGATCCRNANGACDIDCDFDKAAAPEVEASEAIDRQPLQVIAPDETVAIDDVEHDADAAPVDDEPEVVK